MALAVVAEPQVGQLSGRHPQRALTAGQRWRRGRPVLDRRRQFLAAEQVGEPDRRGLRARLTQRQLRGVRRPRVGQQTGRQHLGAPAAAHPAPQLLIGHRDPHRAAEHLADRQIVRGARHHATVTPFVRRGQTDRQGGGEHQVDLTRQPLRTPGELVEYPGELFVALTGEVGHGPTVAGRDRAPGAITRRSPSVFSRAERS